MANDSPNPLFAYAEARIAAWQAVLASLKAALSLDPGGQTIEGIDLSGVAQNGDLGQPIDLPDGAFQGKSIPACIKIYLSAVKKKKTLKEIATALQDGGVETTAKNFENPVFTALARLKAAGEVLKFKDGWGLSTWYPANLRGSIPAPSKGSKNKKKGKRTKAKPISNEHHASAKSASKVANVTEIAQPGEKTEPRILGFLQAGQREASAAEIAGALGLKIQTAHLVLGKLVQKGKLEKLPSGTFKARGVAAS